MRDIEFVLARVQSLQKKMSWFKPNNFYDATMQMERTGEMFGEILNLMEEHIQILRDCSCTVCGQAMQSDHALKRHITMKHKGNDYGSRKAFDQETAKVC